MPANLVSTDSVRAVLGVSAKELPDKVLTDPIFATELKEDIYAMNSQMLADFITIGAFTTPSSAQQRFLDVMEAYAAYNVAAQCLASLPVFSPLTIKDEKAELTRGQQFWQNLAADVQSGLARMATRLQAVYALVNAAAPAPASVVLTVGSAIGLGVDPITGA